MSKLDAGTRDRIRTALLGWFRAGHRDLPWRRTSDPYAIWISEIMLQQTRVETVKDYYRRFLERFPDPQALAEAPLDEVLHLWSGLGYYGRARNLHAAAREIAARHGGRFPEDPEAVLALPGIGPYTAGAVRSIALRQRAALVDGNVIRVLSRLFGVEGAPDDTRARRRYWDLAEALVPDAPAAAELPNDPGDFNQALMELGATICLPQRPSCLCCPVASLCRARREGDPGRYPPPKRVRAVPTVDVVTLLCRHQGRVLLCRRVPAGLWGGLFEPPTEEAAGEGEDLAALGRLCAGRLGLRLGGAALEAAAPLSPFEYVLTHRRMRFRPYLLTLGERRAPKVRPAQGYDDARWIDPRGPVALGLSAWAASLLGREELRTERTPKDADRDA